MRTIHSKGQHHICDYDVDEFSFRKYFEELFETTDLENLHKTDTAKDVSGQAEIHDVESNLHKRFYHDIKTRPVFKELYCRFIRKLFEVQFPGERALIYQSFPSVRFQYPGNIAVPKHCDSDELGKHPLGEKNYLIPITAMHGTQRLFLESEPLKGDFEGYDLEIGQFLAFNGNTCIHYNETNVEHTLRISLDFRVLTTKDYMKYILGGPVTSTNPRDPEKTRTPTRMIIGGYYQLFFNDMTLPQMMESWHFQKEMLLQSRPVFDECEARATFEYMRDGTNFVTEYKKTEELEAMICAFTGAKHVIMTTSGTSAIMLALLAHKIGVGDHVIVPDYTMIATANAVRALGAIPILVDVSPLTQTITLDAIRQTISRSTVPIKAVIHVSLNNRHAGIEEIADFCASNNIQLIEDAAQSLGCFVRPGRHYGTFGSIGCFSLSTPKIISTGQGGFCITNNDDFAAEMRRIKNFGRQYGGVDVFETFGLNMKFTDLQAVVGIEQMKKLPARVERMHAIFSNYYSVLYPIMKPAPFESWIPWFVEVDVPSRDMLMFFLKQHNLQTRPAYPPVHTAPMYLDAGSQFSHAQAISDKGLFLPTHFELNDATIFHICRLVRLFYGF